MKLLRARKMVVMPLLTIAACSFGAGYAYSAMRQSDYEMIRVAYANGYKDALEFAFGAKPDTLHQLKKDFDLLKSRVLYAADAYVEKVAELNR